MANETNAHVPGAWRDYWRDGRVIANYYSLRNPPRLLAFIWPDESERAGYTFWNFIDQPTIGM